MLYRDLCFAAAVQILCSRHKLTPCVNTWSYCSRGRGVMNSYTLHSLTEMSGRRRDPTDVLAIQLETDDYSNASVWTGLGGTIDIWPLFATSVTFRRTLATT